MRRDLAHQSAIRKTFNIKVMKDEFTRSWIINNSVNILSRYEDGILTIRGLHYQLVSIGMTNDIQHYKRVVAAMEQARWDGTISFEAFSDRDRAMVGETKSKETIIEDKIDEAKTQVRAWISYYNKNAWENQPDHVEVLIEKKALEGVFASRCKFHAVALGACKGYPSLTFLYEMAQRLKEVQDTGKRPVILYFGDYDPSGDDIPRSLVENLNRLGVEVHLHRVALNHDQVVAWKLPPAPVKQTDSRTANWDGLGQVELDAVKPEKLMELLDNAISEYFDPDLHEELREQAIEERRIYQAALKEYVQTL